MTAVNGAGGTSRRAFLGRAAGAAAAVAGAGVGAGAFAHGAAAAPVKGSGKFAISIQGGASSCINGMDGGDIQNAVVDDPVGSDLIQRKHLGGSTRSDCTLRVGSAMSKSMYQWISDSIVRGWDPTQKRRATVTAIGPSRQSMARRSFQDAFITELALPALDVQSTKVAQLAVTIRATQVTDSPGGGSPVVAAKQKAWMCSNFKINIDGVDASRVNKVEAIVVKQRIQDDGSTVMDVDPIGLVCDISTLPDWQKWLANLQSGAPDERKGKLIVNGTTAGVTFTAGLSNLGVYQITPDHPIGGLQNGRIRVELYCEEMTFDYKSA